MRLRALMDRPGRLYGENLEANLRAPSDRLKRGAYPPPALSSAGVYPEAGWSPAPAHRHPSPGRYNRPAGHGVEVLNALYEGELRWMFL